MKKITKLFFLIAFISVSTFASAQSFTVAELVDLVPNGKEHFESVVTAKGYSNHQETQPTGLTTDLTYTNGENEVTLITPSFGTDLRMVSWQFKTPAFYTNVKKELVSNGYALKNTENRKAGKYLSLYYSRPGIDIILTTDKTVDPNGIYIVSAKYTNTAKYITK